MLTSDLLRVRATRIKVVPQYLDARDPELLDLAGRLIASFHERAQQTRGELEEDLREAVGDAPGRLIDQGLVKLLEDRCDFEVSAGHPPPELRELVFSAAATARAAGTFAREAVLTSVGTELGLSAAQVEDALFADLKSEQRLTKFDDITPERLLDRYNVALAQGVLLRASGVTVHIHNPPPTRLRHLLRQAKFRRLMCTAERLPGGTVRFNLDGPLSLFSATTKYGMQLAQFLPSILLCESFELSAELRWGPKKVRKEFDLSDEAGLVSHERDTGSYTPPELAMFAELFARKATGWTISPEADIVALGKGFWVPDYSLVHDDTGKTVRLEVLGFWRRSSVEQHLARLKAFAREPFLLAVSDQLHIADDELIDFPAEVLRFRQMPLPDEVAKAANALISAGGKRGS